MSWSVAAPPPTRLSGSPGQGTSGGCERQGELVYDLILRDATLVTASGREVADVALKRGKIAYVGPRPPRRAKNEISAIGRFLIPGVIDTGAQFDLDSDPERWEQESRAAVTGGVTSVINLPWGKNPVLDRASARARTPRRRTAA